MATLCQIVIPVLIYNSNAIIKRFVNLLNSGDLYMFPLNSLSVMWKITQL